MALIDKINVALNKSTLKGKQAITKGLIKTHWPAAEQHRNCRKRRSNCLSPRRGRVFERPAVSSSAGHPPQAGKGHRAPFLLVRFLWANKENERNRTTLIGRAFLAEKV
ncbi:MAG: hypothetical protein P8Y63_11175 [Deltaproteobacteria bacterium]|jgi:hypothetical protein